MDPRLLDARDLPAQEETEKPKAPEGSAPAGVGFGFPADFDPLQVRPVQLEPVVARCSAAPDPELPTTIEQLRNIIRAEVLRVLSTVPRGEA